jgi:hypothetical protein
MSTVPIIILLTALAVAGCAPAEPVVVAGTSPGQPQAAQATVALGERARVAGLTLTPLAVLEDSRCAKDVTCVWAGTVRVRARLDADNGSRMIEMELGKPTEIGAVLSAVGPERLSSAPIDQTAYRFTFAEAR